MRGINLVGTFALALLAAVALTGTASARVALDPGFSGDGWLTTWVAQSSSGARRSSALPAATSTRTRRRTSTPAPSAPTTPS